MQAEIWRRAAKMILACMPQRTFTKSIDEEEDGAEQSESSFMVDSNESDSEIFQAKQDEHTLEKWYEHYNWSPELGIDGPPYPEDHPFEDSNFPTTPRKDNLPWWFPRSPYSGCDAPTKHLCR